MSTTNQLWWLAKTLLTSSASLISPTALVLNTLTTVSQLKSRVCRFLHAVNTEVKQCIWSPPADSAKALSSPSSKPSWIPTCCHFLGILQAIRFWKWRSSGSFCKQVCSILEPAKNRIGQCFIKRIIQNHRVSK